MKKLKPPREIVTKDNYLFYPRSSNVNLVRVKQVYPNKPSNLG